MSENPLSFTTAHFIKSAASIPGLGPDSGREVAFVGRSNVGKSSTLNALCGQSRLARTSQTPGRTQLINLFSVAEDLRLVDLPGYGYAKVSKAVQDEWHQLLDRYLRERQSLVALILIMDCRHLFKPFEQEVIDWAEEINLPYHILLNKADKLSHNEAQKVLFTVKKVEMSGSYQLFSAAKKQGVNEAREKISHWLQEQSQ